jgi:hypothetical protein
VGVPAWSATVLASCLLVGRCSSPAPGDRGLRAAWTTAGSRAAGGGPAGTRSLRSALDAGGGQVAARPAGNRPVRVRGSGSPGAAPQVRPVRAPRMPRAPTRLRAGAGSWLLASLAVALSAFLLQQHPGSRPGDA